MLLVCTTCAAPSCRAASDLAVVLHDGDGLVAGQRGHVQNHQPQRAAADDGHGIAWARMRIFKPMHRAGQRLGERRVLQRHMFRHMERVLGHDARGNADELGIGAVVEEQIVAEIFLAASAEVTLAAGAELSATTRSPGAKSVTPSPASTTVPASSWPNSAGGTIMRAW